MGSFHARSRPDSGAVNAIAAIAACALIGPSTLHADTIYVNGDLWTGSPEGNGSIVDPFTHFGSAESAMQDGDEIAAAGLFRRENGFDTEISDKADFTISQWPGESNAIFDGGESLEPASFVTAVAGSRYVIVLQPDLTVTGVTEDYAPIGGGDPRFKGHLRLAASAAAVEITPMSWFYDAATGELHVHPVGGSDPQVSGVALEFMQAGDGIRLRRCHDWTISDLEFRRTSDDGSEGYGINAQSCTGATIERVKTIDTGAHSLGFSGLECSGNRIIDCDMYGMQGGPNGQNHVVFFSNDEPISDCICVGSTFHLYGALDPQGQPVNSARIVIGAFQHTSVGVETGGILWSNCAFIGYDGHESRPWGGGPCHIAAPSDTTDRSQYAIVLEDCVASNCTGIFATGDYASVFFDRCTLDLSRRDSAPAGVTVGAIQAAMRFGYNTVDTGTGFRACEIILNTPAAASAGTGIAFLKGSSYSFELCTVDFRGPATHDVIRNVALPLGSALLNQSVFLREVGGSLFGGVTQSASDVSIDVPNWYYGVTEFGAGPGLDTQSEWSSSLDPLGVYDVDPQFVDPANGDYSGQSGDAIHDNVWHDNRFAPVLGVGGNLYDCHFGAKQYGPTSCLGDLDESGIVDGADLAVLLADWGQSSATADLNFDGVVDGADLAMLLASWGACE